MGTQKRVRFVETNVNYAGERPSALGFFFMFRDIIFRRDGSVLGFILIETSIAVGLSFVAMSTCPDVGCRASPNPTSAKDAGLAD